MSKKHRDVRRILRNDRFVHVRTVGSNRVAGWRPSRKAEHLLLVAILLPLPRRAEDEQAGHAEHHRHADGGDEVGCRGGEGHAGDRTDRRRAEPRATGGGVAGPYATGDTRFRA